MTSDQDRPRISVVIPTYNRCDMLRTTLEHLTRQQLPAAEFEVIVADDGSSDATAEVVQSFADRLRVKYHFQEDLGFRAGTARNAGAALATAPILFFLDTGPLFGTDLLLRHLAAHGQDTERRAVIGYAHGYSPEKDTSWVTEAVERLGPEETVARYADDPDFRDVRHEQLMNVKAGTDLLPWRLFWTINCSLRLADFRAVGGFDERFHGWGGEDTELGFRLSRHGVRFEVVEDAWVVDLPHEREQFDLWEQFAQNMLHFLAEHREPVVEIGWALAVKHLFISYEEDYRALVEWQERARDTDVAAELAEAVRHLPPGAKIAVLGAGAEIPAAVPPAALLDFDAALLAKATASGRHTGHHTMGLRTALPDQSVDAVIVTSRMAGLWDRWRNELLAEARRIGREVRVPDGF
ncbi:glycosyltransferase [Amycolatopsis sp. SID8362]|uniref:glycosyltransferase family 2 protein n=1 Tax=Amycolatopsis sp. SID8362 TaxID=2690346 RepID=UPI0013705874|nr:glycosyltransferase [Amycolatopsis sp. SID8362]NBH02466.1 glycosyltransferase [Amycolatopsis sp. SID8362]NED39170.1 glycosyltransferase [Amycolatopsis sp. SID8362]